ncbi:hypothetical protein ACF1BQ_007920 [Bradyrhizobium sp. RDT10]
MMVEMKVSVLCSSTTHPIYPHLEQWVRALRLITRSNWFGKKES